MDVPEWAAFVGEVNRRLFSFGFELKSTKRVSDDGTRIWALINTQDDAFALVATEHAANEMELMNCIVRALVKEDIHGKLTRIHRSGSSSSKSRRRRTRSRRTSTCTRPA